MAVAKEQSAQLLDFTISRRAVLGGSAGLVFAYTVGLDLVPGAHAQGAPGAGNRAADGAGTKATRISAYVSIAADGTITILNPAAEMGQGVMTGLPLIVAEEMDADWNRVVIDQAPIAPVYNHPIFRQQYVVASISTFGYWTPLRIAGAQTRRVLMDAAAERWGVPVAEITTEPSTVVHAASGRRMTYGEVASFAKVPAEPPKIDPEKDLKPADKYRLLGRNYPRVDVPSKTNGTARYGIDVKVPGMVYATFVRAPVRGAAPVSSNAQALGKLTGVTNVLTFDHGIGIVGQTYGDVLRARRELKATWAQDQPGQVLESDRDLQEHLAHARDLKRTGVVWKAKGDAAKAISEAERVVSREYLSDLVYHAQLEPMNSTVHVRGDTAEVWVGTQAPTRTAIDVAKVIGTTPDKVTVHQQYMGGGFGRRATVEGSVDAALLSKAVGKPVKLILTREDDLQAGTFRPLTAQRIDAGLDKNGRIVGWRQRVAGELVGDFVYYRGYVKEAKDRDTIFMYQAELSGYDRVPNWVSEHVVEPERTRTAAYRGIGSGYTKFAIESMIDEIAHENKADPLAFRLGMIDDQRSRRVLERVAQMANWGRKRENSSLGIAFTEYGAGAPKVMSLCAGIAEISVDEKTGRIRVHNYWTVADPGFVVNPAGVAAQLESAVVWGLSSCLKERVTMRGGVAQQTNFHDYQVMRMSEMPNIHVEVLTSGNTPTMVGELAVPATGPAVANAVFAATGKRLRHLPFTPERVLGALKA